MKYISGDGKYAIVNVGAAYPTSPLMLFITSNARESFSYIPEEKSDGKDICVTGWQSYIKESLRSSFTRKVIVR